MILDPDYARCFTQARIIAWQYGYACTLHGSATRDLDIVLVPWTDRALPNHDQLLKLIAKACGLRFKDGKENVYESEPDYSDKPHGRRACSLYFPGFHDGRWLDISIMPCTPSQQLRELVAAEDAAGGVLAVGSAPTVTELIEKELLGKDACGVPPTEGGQR